MIKSICIFILLLLIISCNTGSTKTECSKFKNGKFKYLGKESGDIYIIERNDSFQIENDLTTGSITTLKIEWTNECEYNLTYLSRKNSPTDTLQKLATELILKNKIIAVNKDYYIFSAQAVGMKKILTDTLRVLELQ